MKEKGGVTMGSWFSNLHIPKTGGLTREMVLDYVKKQMAGQGYEITPDAGEAACGVALAAQPEDSWFSLYSDAFTFDAPEHFKAMAQPMARELGTRILGISCLDSDYLYLNLIGEDLDIWASVGRGAPYEIRRRTNSKAWKPHVSDYFRFLAELKKPHIFAEAALETLAPCLGLDMEKSAGKYEYLQDMGLAEQAQYLYFRLPQNASPEGEPPKLRMSGTPIYCALGKREAVMCLNEGGASRGLWVYILGPFVEHGEVTFTATELSYGRNRSRVDVPITLEKAQLADGRWAYCYHDPSLSIPEQVDPRLPMRRRMEVEFDRTIVFRFTPEGDPRKMLDITVVMVPDGDRKGQAGWNCWMPYGSKEAFIQKYNERYSRFPIPNVQALNREDFD